MRWTKKTERLKQEPCDDAISRQEVCNIVDAIRDCISVEGYWAILERLKKLPPVNPQPCEDAISRQDVLDLAKQGILVSNGNYKAVCKAINEIPSVNPQPCEDVISRQAAIDFINNHLPFRATSEVYDAYADCVRMLGDNKALPSVNPTRTGHWIYKQYGGYPECGDYYCSECDKIDNRIPTYCPHCGARMVEPQERSGEE